MIKYLTVDDIKYLDIKPIFQSNESLFTELKNNSISSLNRFLRQYNLEPQKVLLKKSVDNNEWFNSMGYDRILINITDNVVENDELNIYGRNIEDGKEYKINKTFDLKYIDDKNITHFSVPLEIYNEYKIDSPNCLDSYLCSGEIYDLCYNVFIYTVIKQGVIQQNDIWSIRLNQIKKDIDNILKNPFSIGSDLDSSVKTNVFSYLDIKM